VSNIWNDYIADQTNDILWKKHFAATFPVPTNLAGDITWREHFRNQFIILYGKCKLCGIKNREPMFSLCKCVPLHKSCLNKLQVQTLSGQYFPMQFNFRECHDCRELFCYAPSPFSRALNSVLYDVISSEFPEIVWIIMISVIFLYSFAWLPYQYYLYSVLPVTLYHICHNIFTHTNNTVRRRLVLISRNLYVLEKKSRYIEKGVYEDSIGPCSSMKEI
jgi:hypothetical protein